MKKFFSLFAAVLFAGSMFAAEMTCAEAAAAALAGSTEEATVTGYVTSIKDAWSSQFKNISFWMADTKDGGEVFQAYRCACANEADAPAVGDKVKVTGTLANWNGTPEMAQGCTFEMIERGEPVAPSEFGVLGVAEAIALAAEGELKDNDVLSVIGIVTKIEFKGKNFAKYGSANIYVADVNGEEGEFEFYNCYSLEADTFRTSVPAFDAESTQWGSFDEVADGNGNTVKIGDKVIARGPYTLYGNKHELNQGCFLTAINPKEEGIEETAEEGKAVKVIRDGQVFILRGGKTFNLTGAEVK